MSQYSRRSRAEKDPAPLLFFATFTVQSLLLYFTYRVMPFWNLYAIIFLYISLFCAIYSGNILFKNIQKSIVIESIFFIIGVLIIELLLNC